MDNMQTLALCAKVYEKKLREVLTEKDFEELQIHAFQLLKAGDVVCVKDSDFKDFLKKMGKVTEEEIKEVLELMPLLADPDVDDFEFEPDDDDDFDISDDDGDFVDEE